LSHEGHALANAFVGQVRGDVERVEQMLRIRQRFEQRFDGGSVAFFGERNRRFAANRVRIVAQRCVKLRGHDAGSLVGCEHARGANGGRPHDRIGVVEQREYAISGYGSAAASGSPERLKSDLGMRAAERIVESVRRNVPAEFREPERSKFANAGVGIIEPAAQHFCNGGAE
jgi:hypothetical protein